MNNYNTAKSFGKIISAIATVLAALFLVSFVCIKSLSAYADDTAVAADPAVYSVSYNLENITVQDQASHNQATGNTEFSVTLKPASGYVEVDRKSVTVTIVDETTDKFVFNDKTGLLTIYAAAVVGDITISASALTTASDYTVTATSTNGIVNSPSTLTKNDDYTATFTAKDGYVLYSKVKTLKSGKVNLLDYPEAYTYNRSDDLLTATLTVYKDYITDDLTVAWNAQQIKLKTSLTNATLLETDLVLTLGEDITFTIVPAEYNVLPDTISLYYSDTTSGDLMPAEAYTYDNQTGVVTVYGQYITDVICVKVNAPFIPVNVTYELSHLTANQYSSYDINSASYSKGWGVYLTPDANYRLTKDNITIKVNGEVIDSALYSLSNTNGLTINKDVIFGDVEIIADAIPTGLIIEYDLLYMQLANAPETHDVNLAWPSDTTFTFTNVTGYIAPETTDNNYFKLFVDGVEIPLGSGWTVYKTGTRLFINKATFAKAKTIKIYAHAKPIDFTMSLRTTALGTIDTEATTFNIETQADPTQVATIAPKAGYKFDYWKVVYSENAAYEVGSKYTWTKGSLGNVTIEAQYTPIEYTITIDAGEHGTTSTTQLNYTIKTQTINMPEVEVEDHYTLTHWLITSASGSWEEGEFVWVKGGYGDISLVAQYELTKYTITLDATSRGSLAGDTVLTYTYLTTEDPVIENPTPNGPFEFANWKVSTASGSWEEGDYTWTQNSYGNITLTAQYAAKQYTITFVDGDHGTVSSYSLDYDTNMATITMPTVSADEHYSFDKWVVTVADGSWEVGQTFVYAEGTYGNITLKPVFVADQFTITLTTDNKGTLEVSTYTYSYGQTEGPNMNTPQPHHDGYEFDRWEVVSTSGSWTAGEQYVWDSTSYGDVTLIARYRALSNRPYTVYHYYKPMYSDEYILAEAYTQTLYGTTWETVTVSPIFIPGYKFDSSAPLNDLTKQLIGDGADTFSIYYKIGTFVVSYTVTNITVSEANVHNKTYNPYETVYGEAFYVYLRPEAHYHIAENSILFKINNEFVNLDYSMTTTNRLDLPAGQITGDLEIILDARLDSFTVEYELSDTLQIVEAENNYSASYGVQFKVYLTSTADQEIYIFPTVATTKIYIDGVLLETGYSTSQSTNYIQINAPYVTGNIKIVAEPAPREYSITYKGLAGDVVVKYNAFTDVTLTALEKTGYSLVAYTFNSTSNNYKWGQKFEGNRIETLNVGTGLTGNISLVPEFSPVEYNITLNTDNKGTVNTQTVKYTIEDTEAPQLPTVRAKNGYTFDNWQITSVSGNWSTGDYSWQEGNYGDITLTAQYSLVVYTIRIDNVDHATVSFSEVTYTVENTEAPQLPTVSVDSGYEHSGWYIFAQAAGNWGSTSNYNWQVGRFGDLTIRPTINLVEYTITYLPGLHGTFESTTKTYTIETVNQPATPNLQTDAGYDFVGWEITTASGSWQTGYYMWETGNYGDIVLTATYSARTDVAYITRYYLEDLNGNFEEGLQYENVQIGQTDQFVEAEIISITGYVLDDSNPLNVLEGTIPGENLLTLKCYYKRQVFNVLINTSNNEYGQISNSTLANVKYETPIVVDGNTLTIGGYQIVATASDPTVDKVYTFTGWAGVDKGVITEDLAIVANFATETRLYTIVFKNGNQIVQTLHLEYGATPEYSSIVPEKEGGKDYKYNFVGWCLDGSDEVLSTIPNVTCDAVYNAHYEVENQSKLLIIILLAVGGGLLLLSSGLIITVAVLRKKPKNKF